jgi:molybdenum cofactor cytidylyltransferase
MRLAAIVLAAGRSTRMPAGCNKLLAVVDGRPVVRAAVEGALAAGLEPVVVVTGHEAEAVEAALAGLDVRCVRNPRYGEGMGSSLAAGLAALPDDLDGMAVFLGDMPRVAVATVRRLAAAATPGFICVPVCRGRRGHPVLWPADFFDDLRALSGDVGGRGILTRRAAAVREVAMDDEGILLDVDTADDLAGLTDGAREAS